MNNFLLQDLAERSKKVPSIKNAVESVSTEARRPSNFDSDRRHSKEWVHFASLMDFLPGGLFFEPDYGFGTSRSETWLAWLWLVLASMVREDKRLPTSREGKRTASCVEAGVFFLHLFPVSLGHNDKQNK